MKNNKNKKTQLSLQDRFQASMKSIGLGQSTKRILSLLIGAAITSLTLSALADGHHWAIVIDAEFPDAPDDNGFRLHPTGRGGRDWSVRSSLGNTERALRENGFLSVPLGGYSASFSIFQDEQYVGPSIKTRGTGVTYYFPCQIVGGPVIVAWDSGSGSGCAREIKNLEEGGVQEILEIGRSPIDQLSANLSVNPWASTIFKVSSALGFQNKQNTEKIDPKEVSDNVLVQPGESYTLIRTVNRPYRDFIQYYLGRCTPEERERGEGEWCQRAQVGSVDESEDHILQDRVAVELESVTIEVLEGDISVSSEQEPEPVTVQQGETYTYPNDARNGIDVDQEANSCEVLRFLNYAYWRAPNVSQSAAEELAAHLKHHRDALGVAGRPPNNLSDLEQEIFDEMNRARNDPQAYAAKLKENQQFFTDNVLKIPEAVIDSRGKARAVNETVALLQKQSPLPPLTISTGMSQANQDHVAHQGQGNTSFGHVGDNGVGTAARLRKYGTVGCVEYDEDQYENIVYFEASSSQDTPIAQAVVMEMLINSKPRRTGNSQNLFNPDYQVTGVACGTYGSSGEMCVVTYADGYLEKN